MAKTIVLKGLTPEVTVHAFVDLVDSQVKFKAIFKRANADESLAVKGELTSIMEEQIAVKFKGDRAKDLQEQSNQLVRDWLIRCEGVQDDDKKPVEYSKDVLDAMLSSVGYAKALGNALGRSLNSNSKKNSLSGN